MRNPGGASSNLPARFDQRPILLSVMREAKLSAKSWFESLCFFMAWLPQERMQEYNARFYNMTGCELLAQNSGGLALLPLLTPMALTFGSSPAL